MLYSCHIMYLSQSLVHSQKSGPGKSPSSGSPKTSMKKRFNTLATQRAQWDVQQGEAVFINTYKEI